MSSQDLVFIKSLLEIPWKFVWLDL